MGESIRSILEGIFGTLLYDLLLAGLVAAVLASLRAKKEKWAAPVLYALSGFAAVLVIAFVFTGHGLLYKEQPRTTPENVEANVKAWCDAFELGMQKLPDNTMKWLLEVHLRYNGRVLRVGVPQQGHYLEFMATLTPTSEQRVALDNLPKKQKQEVIDEVNLELERSKIGYVLLGVDQSPLQGTLLTKGVPITDSLNEDSFMSNINEMDSAIGLAGYAITVALEHHTN